MELCEVNNIINFYTDFSMGTCYYLWQAMVEEFSSDALSSQKMRWGGLEKLHAFLSIWDKG